MNIADTQPSHHAMFRVNKCKAQYNPRVARSFSWHRSTGTVVVTLDADFRTLSTVSGASAPSVIRIRIEGLQAKDLASLLESVLKLCGDDLINGAMVSVTENGIRIRRLPILR